jgi:hypothetical protein
MKFLIFIYKVTVNKRCSLKHVTYYISEPEQPFVQSIGYKRLCQVFSNVEESEIEVYIPAESKFYYGLTVKDTRNLAVKNNVTLPAGWCDEQASSDCLLSFLRRKNKLSIRISQATSLSRAAMFYKHTVEMFIAYLGQAYDKYNFQCQDIYNTDETAVTTVQ